MPNCDNPIPEEDEGSIKLEFLRQALLEGEASGVYEGDIVADMDAYMKQLEAHRERLSAYRGLWKDQPETQDAEGFVRRLRDELGS